MEDGVGLVILFLDICGVTTLAVQSHNLSIIIGQFNQSHNEMPLESHEVYLMEMARAEDRGVLTVTGCVIRLLVF